MDHLLLLSLDPHFPKELKISFATCSSKEVKEGALFFALPGAKTDGHFFLKEAKEKGAVAAVVHTAYSGESFGLYLIFVDDVLHALHKLAKLAMKKRTSKVIAITGSLGKTTTKEFIAALLSKGGVVFKTPGNANSQVGLPISLLNAEPADFDILEMGMTGFGQIERLVQIAPPDLAVITKIEWVHPKEFVEGIQGIANAKAEILSGEKKVKAILFSELLQFESFEKHQDRVIVKEFRMQGGLYFDFEGKERGPFYLPFQEKHLLANFVLAATVALVLGISEEAIQEAASSLTGMERRFQKVEKRGVTLINDSYNAAAASIIAALENLPKPSFGKTIAVLGSMADMGPFSKTEHEKVGKKAVEICDEILCLGNEALPIVEIAKEKGVTASLFPDRLSLEKRLKEIAKEGDVVLIKGSNYHELWNLVERF